MSRGRAGFTLLEVLGAVVILGLVGVSLITSSMNATILAGQARDRLVASLLADGVLADVELEAAAGRLIPGTSENERDGFQIAVTVSAADLGALTGGTPAEHERGEGPAAGLEDTRGAPPSLLELHVEVTDSSGLVVERTSFMFDGTASPELQALAPIDAGPAVDVDDGEAAQ